MICNPLRISSNRALIDSAEFGAAVQPRTLGFVRWLAQSIHVVVSSSAARYSCRGERLFNRVARPHDGLRMRRRPKRHRWAPQYGRRNLTLLKIRCKSKMLHSYYQTIVLSVLRPCHPCDPSSHWPSTDGKSGARMASAIAANE